MKTILVPIDFSAATETVVGHAAELARSLQARLVLLTVTQPPRFVAEYGPLLQDIAEITAAGEKAAACQLEQLQQELTGDFISCDVVQMVGAPVEHILSEADRVAADFIVMGSHGHTALYDLLVGSTTHGVLKRAKCPVVIVPAARARAIHKPASELAVAL